MPGSGIRLGFAPPRRFCTAVTPSVTPTKSGPEAWFHAYLMGWPRISVYDGGWLEWAQDPSNPRAQGDDFHRAEGS
jgi:hypothetical protein